MFLYQKDYKCFKFIGGLIMITIVVFGACGIKNNKKEKQTINSITIQQISNDDMVYMTVKLGVYAQYEDSYSITYYTSSDEMVTAFWKPGNTNTSIKEVPLHIDEFVEEGRITVDTSGLCDACNKVDFEKEYSLGYKDPQKQFVDSNTSKLDFGNYDTTKNIMNTLNDNMANTIVPYAYCDFAFSSSENETNYIPIDWGFADYDVHYLNDDAYVLIKLETEKINRLLYEDVDLKKYVVDFDNSQLLGKRFEKNLFNYFKDYNAKGVGKRFNGYARDSRQVYINSEIYDLMDKMGMPDNRIISYTFNLENVTTKQFGIDWKYENGDNEIVSSSGDSKWIVKYYITMDNGEKYYLRFDYIFFSADVHSVGVQNVSLFNTEDQLIVCVTGV